MISRWARSRHRKRGGVAKIYTVAEVPSELVQAWLQHLRDFDATHAGCCHFQVAANLPDEATVEDMIEVLQRIEPPLPVIRHYKRRRKQ